jgi:hypothetical protein
MLAPDIEIQIRALGIASDRALVVCDVDEVVVHFLRAFEAFLGDNDLWLDAASFALNGNVRRREGNKPVPADELRVLITRFFTERARKLEPIEGAHAALSSLARRAQVVLLSNIPAAFRDDRLANLADHGFSYPLVVNQGPKGPAVRTMIERHASAVVFIDDVPSYVTSVAEHCPAVNLVHFLQDRRFARHVEPLACAPFRTDNWREAHDHIQGLLVRAEAPKLV